MIIFYFSIIFVTLSFILFFDLGRSFSPHLYNISFFWFDAISIVKVICGAVTHFAYVLLILRILSFLIFYLMYFHFSCLILYCTFQTFHFPFYIFYSLFFISYFSFIICVILGSVTQGDFRDVLQEKLRAGLGARDLDDLESGYRDPEDPRKVSISYLLAFIIVFFSCYFPRIIFIFSILFRF